SIPRLRDSEGDDDDRRRLRRRGGLTRRRTLGHTGPLRRHDSAQNATRSFSLRRRAARTGDHPAPAESGLCARRRTFRSERHDRVILTLAALLISVLSLATTIVFTVRQERWRRYVFADEERDRKQRR